MPRYHHCCIVLAESLSEYSLKSSYRILRAHNSDKNMTLTLHGRF